MNTRSIASLVLLGALGCAGSLAHAVEFSMGGESLPGEVFASQASTGPVNLDTGTRGASGGDDAYFVGDAPVAEPTAARSATDADTTTAPANAAGPARATTSGATSTAASRARNGNRWQSLVPGAIK